MSVQRTRDAVERYLNSAHTDLSMMADDVVFTTMATGDEHRGVEGVRRMLHYVYHEAFEAKAETRNRIYAENNAVLEGDFVGKHIGTFAGIEATGRQVRVPLRPSKRHCPVSAAANVSCTASSAATGSRSSLSAYR